MKQYEVLAPFLVFGIHGENGTSDYALRQGDQVELPEDNVAVRAMMSRGQIREVGAPRPSKSKKQ